MLSNSQWFQNMYKSWILSWGFAEMVVVFLFSIPDVEDMKDRLALLLDYPGL